MHKYSIEYFKVLNNKVLVKEKNCDERFLNNKELKILGKEFKRSQLREQKFKRIYHQSTYSKYYIRK